MPDIGWGIMHIVATNYLWQDVGFCEYFVIIHQSSFAQYWDGNALVASGQLKIIQALWTKGQPGLMSTGPDVAWPDCTIAANNRKKQQCWRGMWLNTQGWPNPVALTQYTGQATVFAQTQGAGTHVVLLGDAARRSYNQLGIGVNFGLRVLTDIMPDLLGLALSADVIAPINARIGASSGHLTDWAQQCMYPRHYCRPIAGGVPGWASATALMMGAVLPYTDANRETLINTEITTQCGLTANNSATATLETLRKFDVTTQAKTYDRSKSKYSVAMSYCPVGTGAALDPQVRRNRGAVPSQQRAAAHGWKPVNNAEVQSVLGKRNVGKGGC